VKIFKRLLVVLPLILVSLSIPSQLPSAYAGVADCLSGGYPSASMSTSTLTITASISVTCTNQQIGNSGGAFLYSVVDESSARCDGPRGITSGTFATLTCSISVGPPNGSSRAGYTSTTIKIWSAYDFSTKFITASHTPIPSNVLQSSKPIPSPSPTSSQQVIPPTTIYGDPSPTDLQACTYGDSQPYWHCEIAPTWRYAICTTASKGYLQSYVKKKWRSIKNVSAIKKPRECLDPRFPFTFTYYDKIYKTNGTYKFRFYFPQENNNKIITISNFKIRVLVGGLDMDAP
jgi:hypothetical protein